MTSAQPTRSNTEIGEPSRQHPSSRSGRRPGRRTAAVAAGLLTAGALFTAGPAARATSASGLQQTQNCLATQPLTCYSVSQFRTAYNVQTLIDHGLTGRGQTVVLPEFSFPPGVTEEGDIRTDLSLFDRTFNLPAAQFSVINSIAHDPTPYLANDEEVGDAEIVHEIAPEAKIDIILVPQTTAQATLTDYLRAYRMAPSLGSVVASTVAVGEPCFTPADAATLHAVLQQDIDQHTTVIASSGDSGAAINACTNPPTPPVKGVGLPAADPDVLGVGGSDLYAARPSGTYRRETVWNDPLPPGTTSTDQPPIASNGGFSTLYAKPGYQDGVGAIGSRRGVPDVAADAGSVTGPALIWVFGNNEELGPGGGTSAGAPFWAGLIALADQAAGRPLGLVNPALYQIGRSEYYHAAFHDITVGNNSVTYPQGSVTGYSAAPDWDPTTGLGTPNAGVLIPLLVQYARHDQ
jgi:subtilase family serine protease